MSTTPRISSLAAVATVAAALSLPTVATARPISDTNMPAETVMQHVAPQAAKWQAYDYASTAYAGPAPAAAVTEADNVSLPIAGGAIAIMILAFGSAATAIKRRKTVRPAVLIG